MKYSLNEQLKTAEIWMTREEEGKLDMGEMKPFFRALKEAKYQPVVYISGTDDLYDTLQSLMLHNLYADAKTKGTESLDSKITAAKEKLGDESQELSSKTCFER